MSSNKKAKKETVGISEKRNNIFEVYIPGAWGCVDLACRTIAGRSKAIQIAAIVKAAMSQHGLAQGISQLERGYFDPPVQVGEV